MQISSLLIESLKRTPRERKSGIYYPSDIGYCARKIYYSHVVPAEEKPPADADIPMMLNFAMGDAIHDKLAQMFSRTKGIRLLENEKAFMSAIDLFEEAGGGDGGFVISGRLDDLIEVEVGPDDVDTKVSIADKIQIPCSVEETKAPQPGTPEAASATCENNAEKTPGNEGKQPENTQKVPDNREKRPNNRRVFVVDVKSIKSFDFLDKPKPEHVLQLTYYLRVLRHHYPGISGKLLYVNKIDFSMKEFDVEYDEKTWRGMLDRFKSLHRHITDPKLRKHGPSPEGKLNKEMSWGCGYCPYREMCDFDCGDKGTAWQGAPKEKREEPVEAFL